MARIELTPLSATIMLLLLAVAIGTVVMSWGGLEVGGHEESPAANTLCDPLNTLKMKYINGDITKEDYETMKSTIEGG